MLPKRGFRGLGMAICLFATQLSSVPVSSAPMVTLGDAVYLHVKADSEFQYNSNLTLATKRDDVIDDSLLKFTPALRISLFEESKLTRFNFGMERSLLHFLDESYLNDEPWRLNFNAGYDGYPFSFATAWNKAELLQNINNTDRQFRGEIVRTVAEQFNVNFQVSFSPKTGMRTGLDFSRTDFASIHYQDYDTTSIPLNVFYKFTEKLEGALGYRYRLTESSYPSEHRDHYINANLLGHITPKMDVRFTLGFQNRNSEYFRFPPLSFDTNAFSANLGVDYQATGKIKLSAGLFRDFNVGSSLGETIQYTAFNAGSDILITPTFTFSTAASVWASDYSRPDPTVPKRNDFGANGRVGFTFAPTDSVWTFRSSYAFDWAEFDLGNVDEYTNHKISLSTTWEY
jgi:hypothetical protein